ncbi:hypothetical protein [Sphingobacterium faecium]|uniref:hypothetical protein n=1 Tax=Sphingobacterium faecium TaxID=34087 RepID=UPI00320A5B5D
MTTRSAAGFYSMLTEGRHCTKSYAVRTATNEAPTSTMTDCNTSVSRFQLCGSGAFEGRQNSWQGGKCSVGLTLDLLCEYKRRPIHSF